MSLLAYDIKLMKPGCALVAASLGADSALASRFRTDDWLLVPTTNMNVYEITEDQLQQLIKRTELNNT